MESDKERYNGTTVSSSSPLQDSDVEKRQATSHVVNASGHEDQLKRQYGLLSACAASLTIDNAWVAFGGTITTAISNGGPPGLIYELIAACFYYAFIAASIAELASSIPSAGGVYHWAYATSGKYGRPVGFITGLINFLGWIFGQASITYVASNVIVQMYSLYHEDLVVQQWHVYVVLVILTCLVCAILVFANRVIPFIQTVGMVAVLGGIFVTIIVVAAVPKQHASASFVFTEWENSTGWSSGTAFLLGMLNGAYAIGTPEAVTHFAEELPNPRRDLPLAIAFQMITGSLSTLVYAIAILFAIQDLDGVLNSNGAFPLAAIYGQATGSRGGTFGLLFIVLLSVSSCMIGAGVTCSRLWWALARDNVVPFSLVFSRVSVSKSCPIPATVFCSILITAIGAIQIGSTTAFADVVGSFIILTTVSYLLAVLPHLLSGRRNVPQGRFWMGRFGFAVNALTVLFIVFTDIMFCFPYFLPVEVETMNYNAVILVGAVALSVAWWGVHGRRKYHGPKLAHMGEAGRAVEDDI